MHGRKFESLDLIKLEAMDSAETWNSMLTAAYKRRDINGLAKLLYRLQAGMADAEKAQLATPKLRMHFIRWQKSIEDTAKKIIKSKIPNPLDNPLADTATVHRDAAEAKKKRDHMFELFLRASSF